MNKWDKYSWRIWNWILIFASSLAFQPIKKTKVEENYIKSAFLCILPCNAEKKAPEIMKFA